MIFGACSHVGKVRKENEDSFYIPSEGDTAKLFLIADGIGGQNHGKLASMMVVDSIVKFVVRNYSAWEKKETLLNEAALSANDSIRRFSKESPEFNGMGTTLVSMLMDGQEAYISYAGDSRCYMIRNNIISQLTIDNSYVQYLLQKGAITIEEAQNHPQRHLITKAVGLEENFLPEYEKVSLLPGDILLLCTDGLTAMLSDEEIIHIILKKKRNIQGAAEELVKAANAKGGIDNITAILVEV
ncbi:MAG: Stp1/IreP family PP2C-type Ser/Thr phosphatase [Clostridia bacterium]|nr:Stp1/IreP family PP2C-type Ser/Thr phosphatase [Clostridia bacterium]